MSVLSDIDDVEQVASAWLTRRYGKKLGKVKFVEVMGEGTAWNVKAEAKIAKGVLSVVPHIVRLKIDSQSTEVLGYSETEVRETKERTTS